jgi:hypothetical protein
VRSCSSPVLAHGVELEAQMRLRGQAQGVFSYVFRRARDVASGATLVNSPEQMAKMRVSVPGPEKRSFVSLEVLAMLRAGVRWKFGVK